jgi:site-specific recombinase XerD
MHNKTTQLVIHNEANLVRVETVGVTTPVTTDAEAASLWLKKYADTHHTLAAYRKEAERFLLWLKEREKTLQEITVADVLAYQDFLGDPQPRDKWCLEIERKKLPDGTENPSYISSKKMRHYLNNGMVNPAWRPFVSELSLMAKKQALTILFGFGEFLTAIGYSAINPFRAARKRSTLAVAEITRYLEKETLDKLFIDLEVLPEVKEIDFQRKERAIFVMKFLYLTGLRRNELANMQWEDIRKRRAQYWLHVRGKGRREGYVPLNSTALSVLNRYRKAMHQGAFDGDDEGPVLRNLASNRGVSGQCVHSIITTTLRSCKDKRLLKVSAHWFRHTAASHMLDAGIPLATVRDNLRHANISTTSGYIHTSDDKRHSETENHSI